MNPLEFLGAGSFETWRKDRPGDPGVLPAHHIMTSQKIQPLHKGNGHAHAHCPGVTRGWAASLPSGVLCFLQAEGRPLRTAEPEAELTWRRGPQGAAVCIPSVRPIRAPGAGPACTSPEQRSSFCGEHARSRCCKAPGPALLPSRSLPSICRLGQAHLQVCCGGNAQRGSCFSGSHAGSVEASDELESRAQNTTAVPAFLIVSR